MPNDPTALEQVHYREGYRYQLGKDYEQCVSQSGIYPIRPGGNGFVSLTLDGWLLVRSGYAWDGASGPAYNDKSFVRPSLVHDANCQLWELGVIDDAGRVAADRLLGVMLRQDAIIIANRLSFLPRVMLKAIAMVRPLWVVPAVQFHTKYFANKASDPELTAP